MPKRVKVGPSRIVQGHNFAIDNAIGRKLVECFGGEGISLAKVLAVSGIQGCLAAGFDSDGAIAV